MFAFSFSIRTNPNSQDGGWLTGEDIPKRPDKAL